MNIDKHKIEQNQNFALSDLKTNETGKIESKEDAVIQLAKNIESITELQNMLYAQNKYALLVIIQAMDTAGKDGAIKHVFSGINPQGISVHSFKQPSAEELEHDYLWRASKKLPERGIIGIFNRSYYEEVLVVRVHELIKTQQLPDKLITHAIWKDRFRQIRDYERYLHENGTVILKFFLHVSKEEQKQRLIDRIDDKSKNWKFSAGDVDERQHWDKYQQVYEEAIRETTAKQAPWFVIPADKKWYARLAISEVICKTLESLDLNYPSIDKKQEEVLLECKKRLLNEDK